MSNEYTTSELQYNLYKHEPFKSRKSFLVAHSGTKLKIRLPNRGLITLRASGAGDLQDPVMVEVVGKAQTKKGGFTKKFEKTVPWPKALDNAHNRSTYRWRRDLDMRSLINLIVDFLNSCEKNEVVRERPSIDPETFDSTTHVRTKLRVARAQMIRDCEFTAMCFIRRDNKVIVDHRVANPDLEEDIWVLFDCTSDTGSTFRVLYNGGDIYYKVKKTKRGYSITKSKFPSSHYQYLLRSRGEQALTTSDKDLLDYAMEQIMKGEE